MTPRKITVYYETKGKGKEPFSSRTYGGSIEVELADGDDTKEAYNKAWCTVQAQVLKRMMQELGKQEIDVPDESLGF